MAGAKLFRIPLVFKKSITVLQMTQFVIELVHASHLHPFSALLESCLLPSTLECLQS